MARRGAIRATTWRRHLTKQRPAAPGKGPRRRAVPTLPLRQPYYTADELQQYEYMNAIGDSIEGTVTPEYREERRAWIATQRRAAKRYGAKRARRRPRIVKAKPLSSWVRVRSHRRHRPGKAA